MTLVRKSRSSSPSKNSRPTIRETTWKTPASESGKGNGRALGIRVDGVGCGQSQGFSFISSRVTCFVPGQLVPRSHKFPGNLVLGCGDAGLGCCHGRGASVFSRSGRIFHFHLKQDTLLGNSHQFPLNLSFIPIFLATRNSMHLLTAQFVEIPNR
jgi:hypothetical protein